MLIHHRRIPMSTCLHAVSTNRGLSTRRGSTEDRHRRGTRRLPRPRPQSARPSTALCPRRCNGTPRRCRTRSSDTRGGWPLWTWGCRSRSPPARSSRRNWPGRGTWWRCPKRSSRGAAPRNGPSKSSVCQRLPSDGRLRSPQSRSSRPCPHRWPWGSMGRSCSLPGTGRSTRR